MPGIVLESEQITENLCTCGAAFQWVGDKEKLIQKKFYSNLQSQCQRLEISARRKEMQWTKLGGP